jgi:hypothetical protein
MPHELSFTPIGWRSFGLLCLVAVTPATAANYFVDCGSGSDGNDGRSPSTAWRSIVRANQPAYGPGDNILFKRGCAWQGVGFKAKGYGSVEAPIIVADYGAPNLPRPIIDGVGVHEPAVLLQNVQNWTIRNLELTQHGQTPQALDANNEHGKDADQYSDEYMRAVVHVLGLGPPNDPNCGEGCAVRNIRLENLLVHDGSWNGIYASGGYYQLRTATYGVVENLVIQGVESFNHHKSGVEITCTYYKTPIYATSNIWVLDSYLHHNGGDGAMVGPIRNGLLDGNVCSYNGRFRNARVGCWTWDSENTVIQFNESHHNMTPLNDTHARDGAGFDLDLGTENGILQYNWSHDNQGEGFLLLSYPIGFGYERGDSHHIQMRYNLSERDGKKLAGGITIFGGVTPAVIYNNTIYYESDRLAGTDMFNGEGGAVTTSIWGKSGRPDARFYNNLFITSGRNNPAAVANNAWSDGAGTFTFANNLWWRVDAGVRFQWGGSAIAAWSGWQAAGYDAQGLNADPRVRGSLGGGPDAYAPISISPGIDRGRVVTDALRGMGNQDAFGAATPQGAAYDLGAFEYRVTFPDPAAPRILQTARQLDGSWRFELSGLPARSYLLESSVNLQTWTTAGRATESLPGGYEFIDRTAGSARYHRAVARGLRGL